jgi:hypothetical protein
VPLALALALALACRPVVEMEPGGGSSESDLGVDPSLHCRPAGPPVQTASARGK